MDYTTRNTNAIKNNRRRVLSEPEIIAQFCDAMRAAGLIINASDIVTDSKKFQRCKSEKDRGARKNGYYKLWMDGRPAGVFGIWSTGESHTWSSDTGAAPMSAEDQARLRAEMRRRQAERAAEIKEAQNKAAERAKKIWDKALPADDSHPYLARKGVKAHGLRVGKWWKWDAETSKPYVACENALLVPMYGLRRDIRSLQAIFPDKVEIYGELRDKDYLSSGERSGVFHVLGKPQEIDGRKVVIVAEGYATGATIHECTGHCVLVAFDTGNLLPTAQVFRDKYPDAVIVFAADNDVFTLGNPGLRHARLAAAAVGGKVAFPEFHDLSDELGEDGKLIDRPTDWNDAHMRPGYGLEFIKAGIEAKLYQAPADEPGLVENEQDETMDEPEGEQHGASAEPQPMYAEQYGAARQAPTAQRESMQLGGLVQGGDKLLLSPANRAHLNAALDEFDNTGPWPMGKSGDHHVFLSHRKEVVFIRQQDLFKDHGILELQSLNMWEMFCKSKGKLDRTLIGNHLLELSAIIGEFSSLHIPAKVMHPDVLAGKVSLAEMRVRPSPQTICHYLMIDPAWKGVVWANTFAERVEARRDPPCGGGAGPWTDDHNTRLSAWLTASFKLKELSDRAVDKAVNLLAFADARNPVQDYLTGLTWDAESRIDQWMQKFCGVEDSTYVRNVGAKSLVATVARIMVPGAKVDTITILEGDQGVRKSALLESLLPNLEWFTDSLVGDLGNKDAAIGLQGKVIVEVAEMAALERTGTKVAKAFLSRRVDNYRSPFGIKAMDHPRPCTVWGTYNLEGDGRYLSDPTGARRYWPVLTTRADTDALIACRDQLWAEALHRYKAKEQWWLTPEVEALARLEQAARMECSTWSEHVEQFIVMGPVPGKDGTGWIKRKKPLTKVTTKEIFEAITGRPLINRDTTDSKSICTALKAAGWKQVNGKAYGGRAWLHPDHQDSDDEQDGPP